VSGRTAGSPDALDDPAANDGRYQPLLPELPLSSILGSAEIDCRVNDLPCSNVRVCKRMKSSLHLTNVQEVPGVKPDEPIAWNPVM
jgi:hypothetical protein